MLNKNQTLHLTDYELRLLIREKLALLGAPLLTIKPAWYLTQMYLLANEYGEVAKNLLTATYSNTHQVAEDILWLRELAKELKHNAQHFVKGYEDLKTSFWTKNGLGNQQPDPLVNVDSLNDMFSLHRQYYQGFCNRLQKAGCSEYVSARLVDDVLDLWQELWVLIDHANTLVIEDIQTSEIIELLTKIATPWSELGWHAMYHLGEYEHGNLHNPGVLGWTLAVLSEIHVDLDVKAPTPSDEAPSIDPA